MDIGEFGLKEIVKQDRELLSTKKMVLPLFY